MPTTDHMMGYETKKTKHASFDHLTEDQLWWLGGHFDGDGCVRVCPKEITVDIGKAQNAWATLVYLYHLVGGNLNFKPDSRGGDRQDRGEWKIHGSMAVDFCRVMQAYTFLKRDQLRRAADYPLNGGFIKRMRPVQGTHRDTGEVLTFRSVSEARQNGFMSIIHNLAGTMTHCKNYEWRYLDNPVSPEDVSTTRADITRDLKRMKATAHAPIERDLPLPYVAGFLDADGCVRAYSLSGTQKYRAVCDALARKFGGSVSPVYANAEVRIFRVRGLRSVRIGKDKRRVSRLHVTRKPKVYVKRYEWKSVVRRHVLAILTQLRPYTYEKKPQVDILFEHHHKLNRGRLNAMMSKYKGYQGAAKNARNKPVWKANFDAAVARFNTPDDVVSPAYAAKFWKTP